MIKIKALSIVIIGVMVTGCSSVNNQNDNTEYTQNVTPIQEAKEIETKPSSDMLYTQYVVFKENELVNNEDSTLIGFYDGAYINKISDNDNNIYKYDVTGEVELLSTIDSKYNYCEFKNYEDGIIIVGIVEEDNEKLFDLLSLDYKANEIQYLLSGKSVEVPEVTFDDYNIIITYDDINENNMLENKSVLINKGTTNIPTDNQNNLVVKSVNNTDIYFCDMNNRTDTEITVNSNNILYQDGVMEFDGNIARYTTFKDISGSVFSDGYIDTAYPDYVPTTEYEQLAYDDFIERFGDEPKIINMISIIEENEDAKNGFTTDQWLERIDVEIIFLEEKNIGNLAGGYNTVHCEVGLTDDEEYVIMEGYILG